MVTEEIAREYVVIPRGRYLKVYRQDRQGGISWDTLQEIKQQVWGPESIAVEFYPSENGTMNVANVRHLWRIDRIPWLFDLKASMKDVLTTEEQTASRIMELERQVESLKAERSRLYQRPPLRKRVVDYVVIDTDDFWNTDFEMTADL